jgi:hypothetical protein
MSESGAAICIISQHLRLLARGLGEGLALADAQHAVAHGGALVHLHRAPQPLDQIGARLLELRGALLHHLLELVAAVAEREVQTHPRLQHAGVDRLAT